MTVQQVSLLFDHFAVKRKMGFTGVTVRCWCGVSIELQSESTKQLNDFMEEHAECRPVADVHEHDGFSS